MSDRPESSEERKRKLFEDVSAVQVIATALAAVTSMLLSSYIGIAGSIIGVAVASIVSTLAASLYKKFLADSANKIKHLPVVGTSGETIADFIERTHSIPSVQKDENSSAADQDDGSSDTERSGSSDFSSASDGSTSAQATTLSTTHAASIQSSSVVALSGDHEDNIASDGLSDHSGNTAGDDSTDIAKPTSEDRASASQKSATTSGETHQSDLDDQLKHQKKMVRGLILVCVVSALLAVIASASVVYLATTGEGLGQKTPPITWIANDNGSGNTGKSSSLTSSDVPSEEEEQNALEQNTAASDDPNTDGGDESSNTEVSEPPTNSGPTPSTSPDAPVEEGEASNTE